MRWFKHLSNAYDDEAMSELLDEFGPAGYGIWKYSLYCFPLSGIDVSKISAKYGGGGHGG